MGMPGDKRRVLIVDDNRSVADTLVVVFSFNGYLARAAYSAEQAMSIAAELRPDLAVVDVFLRGIDGIVLATGLRATYPNLKIVLLSGQPAAFDMVARVGNPFELMMKPVHPSDMLRTAARLLRTAVRDESDDAPRSAA
jgi:DNA-binding response OmpR family regulator